MRQVKPVVDENSGGDAMWSTPPTGNPRATSASDLWADEEWALKNERRRVLIHKKYAEGLTPAEEAELGALQAEMARRLDRVAPISFEAVEALEEVAERVRRSPSDEPSSSDPNAP